MFFFKTNSSLISLVNPDINKFSYIGSLPIIPKNIKINVYNKILIHNTSNEENRKARGNELKVVDKDFLRATSENFKVGAPTRHSDPSRGIDFVNHQRKE